MMFNIVQKKLSDTVKFTPNPLKEVKPKGHISAVRYLKATTPSKSKRLYNYV